MHTNARNEFPEDVEQRIRRTNAPATKATSKKGLEEGLPASDSSILISVDHDAILRLLPHFPKLDLTISSTCLCQSVHLDKVYSKRANK
jgi:hypothetical protein